MMQPMPSSDDLLTTGEAARLLQVSIDSVKRWGDRGRLPMLRTPTGHRRFRRSDVEAAMVPVAPASSTS